MNIESTLSSAIIASIVTAVFTLLATRRKDYIENITQERQKWRIDLREVAESINESHNIHSLKANVERLKVRINPYGQVTNHPKDDSFIWEYITRLNKKSDNIDLEIWKSEIVSLIACVLKHDWDRSKKEIAGNAQIMILLIPYTINFLLLSVYCLLNNYPTTAFTETLISQAGVISYLQYCIFMINGVLFCVLLVDYAKYDKDQRDKCVSTCKKIPNCKKWTFSDILRLSCIVILLVVDCVLYFCTFVNCVNTSVLFLWFAIFGPIIYFFYCLVTRDITDRNNMCCLNETVIKIKTDFTSNKV